MFKDYLGVGFLICRMEFVNVAGSKWMMEVLCVMNSTMTFISALGGWKRCNVSLFSLTVHMVRARSDTQTVGSASGLVDLSQYVQKAI